MKHDPWLELLKAVRKSGPAGPRAAAARRRHRRMAIPFDAAELVALRRRFRLSQTQFAQMLGISVATLRGWEQRRRTPDGPARMLLEVCARYPREVLSTASAVLRRRVRDFPLIDAARAPAAQPVHRALDSPVSTRPRRRPARSASHAPG